MMHGICLTKIIAISCLCIKKSSHPNNLLLNNLLTQIAWFFCLKVKVKNSKIFKNKSVFFWPHKTSFAEKNASLYIPYDCNVDTFEKHAIRAHVLLKAPQTSRKAWRSDQKLKVLIDSQQRLCWVSWSLFS